MCNACSTKTAERAKWVQRPKQQDIAVVAGDSYMFSVTTTLPPGLYQYPEWRFSAHIRAQSRLDAAKPDGFFVPATDSPDPWDLIMADDSYEDIVSQADVIVANPHLYRVTKAPAFSDDFDDAFDKEYEYAPTSADCPVKRVYLYLSPIMSRHLFSLRNPDTKSDEVESKVEKWHCYHLPPEANVPPTASGYPEKDQSWESGVSLPVLGGEYDSRVSTAVMNTAPYVGLWDLQVSTLDNKFVRTLLSGEISIAGDVTRRMNVDV